MDIFNEKNLGESAPNMLLQGGSSGPNLAEYRYRVERFELGNQDTDDSRSALEGLLTRSIDGTDDLIIVERKDSISATTGMYTIIVIYLEKRAGGNHA